MIHSQRGLLLTATDLVRHTGCPHATSLEIARLAGQVESAAVDPMMQLLGVKGNEHEKRYLDFLKTRHKDLVEIHRASSDETRNASVALTREAMDKGVSCIYQAALQSDRWFGVVDFLRRVELPSKLGSWSYEIVDTKLSRTFTVSALVQLGVYAELLTEIQGIPPQYLHVITGNFNKNSAEDAQESFRYLDMAALLKRLRADFEAFTATPLTTEPSPVQACTRCQWLPRCEDQWRAQDDLSLVAYMRADHRQDLRESGISTVAQLANATVEDLPRSIGAASRQRLIEQAALQIQERETGVPLFQLLPPTEGLGLLKLPPPSPGDLYLDFEGHPLALNGEPLEYLCGIGARDGSFEALWAHSEQEEEELLRGLLARIMERWEKYPDMHVYHYASYEGTAIKRLVQKYLVGEHALDEILRHGRLVDLYTITRQGIRISKESYSIKKLEAFYRGNERSEKSEVADALASVIAYEQWMHEPNDTILQELYAYNKDDVDSTRELHQWLEERRSELEGHHGELPRHLDEKQPDVPKPIDIEQGNLAQQLTEKGEKLLSHIVTWHRREEKPGWWQVFRYADLDDSAIEDDPSAVGGLSQPEPVGGKTWKLSFPPQDTKLSVGDDVLDVDSATKVGKIVEIEPDKGYLLLDASARFTPGEVRGLIPQGPLSTRVHQDALARLATNHIAGQNSAGARLLRRATPANLTSFPHEAQRERLHRVGTTLQGEILAVQGPPGSGKTSEGAELIRQLIKKGLKVGVTANSHAVIAHLLQSVGLPAVHKSGKVTTSELRITTSNEDALAATLIERLVGGTSWMWARPEFANSVDVLVIDEAGQYSLANALAVSQAAHSLVLLGDPQQLSQPIQGVHPGDAKLSVLEYWLNGEHTMPVDRGIFLDTTFRMHPLITSFVSTMAYDGRLQCADELRLDLQKIEGGEISGSGLRFQGVSHVGRTSRSPEEAEIVANIWKALQSSHFVNAQGERKKIAEEDVLIVSPYNAQVAEIRRRLPEARVGTVDKFQGQQAPVVIYSMASSSAETAPRGFSFLYDLHRFNVAISRAQAMTIVVANPRLAEGLPNKLDDIGALNAFCHYLDSSTHLP